MPYEQGFAVVNNPAANEIEIAKNKLRALDDFIGSDIYDLTDPDKLQYMERITEWEEKFVADVKDQIDRYKRELTIPQFNIITKIWAKATENYGLEKGDIE